MSLLPNRFQIVNDMPSLGTLVKEAIQPKPCPIEAFNKGTHWPKDWTVGVDMAASNSEGTVFIPSSTGPWVKFRVGDIVCHIVNDIPVTITRIGNDESGIPTAWYERHGEETSGHLENLRLVQSAPTSPVVAVVKP